MNNTQDLEEAKKKENMLRELKRESRGHQYQSIGLAHANTSAKLTESPDTAGPFLRKPDIEGARRGREEGGEGDSSDEECVVDKASSAPSLRQRLAQWVNAGSAAEWLAGLPRVSAWPSAWHAALSESASFHFQLAERGTTLDKELYAGLVQFVSCIYILPVVSKQLERAGYHRAQLVIATATVCAIGCTLSSYTTNLPFIVAPPTSVSIFLAVSLQRNRQTRQQGDTAVVLSGLCLMLIGVFRTASRFVTRLIPDSIQASTAVGIGLITALAGAVEIGLVVHGDYTLLAMGDITPAILIAGVALLTIGVSQHFHVKGSFVLGLAVGSVLYWLYDLTAWPSTIAAFPSFDLDTSFGLDNEACILIFNLLFLYLLTINGLARSFSDMAGITNPSGSIPQGNWLFIICGLSTVLSGLLSGPPILISPESAAGIKAGARTGLSTLVAGVLFFGAIFFSPFFSQIPASGTSPLLLLVGMVLFQNVGRINWSQPRESISAFFVLLLIPFTYSIICGIGAGYVVYVAIGLFTGDAWVDLMRLIESYRPEGQPNPNPNPNPNLMRLIESNPCSLTQTSP